MQRCPWCLCDPLYVTYHDTEWGVPLHDDRKIFEFLTLEAFQAGLSWLTVLKKRPAFRAAFADFDPQRVAAFEPGDVDRLLTDAGIIRHRGKIEAAIANARGFLQVVQQHGSFDRYIWNFVAGRPVVNAWTDIAQVPPYTPLAETISHDLRQKGFRFVGPTVVYAHLQATGLVNDHLVDCFRYREVQPHA